MMSNPSNMINIILIHTTIHPRHEQLLVTYMETMIAVRTCPSLNISDSNITIASGKVPKLGRDGLFYDGRITCATCATTFCRNGLWKKFGERVEGNMCSIWMCRLCLSTCCCRSTEECDVVVPDHVQHTHCHNFRCAYSQRKKRRMKREVRIRNHSHT